MRVLLVVHRFPPYFHAGTELHTAGLAHELAASGHEVFVLAGRPQSLRGERYVRDVEYGGLRARFLEKPMEPDFALGLRDDWVRDEFARALDELRPDVVHVQHLLYLSGDLIEVAQARGLPTVVTLHDFWFQCPLVHPEPRTKHSSGATRWGVSCFAHYERRRWRAPLLLFPPRLARVFVTHVRRPGFMRRQLELADVLVAPSPFVRDRFLAFGVPSDKLLVLPHPVDAPAAVSPVATGDRVRFGFVGSITPHKGVGILCEAFQRVPGSASLRLFGSSPDRRYLRALLRGDSRIRYEGEFDHERVSDVYEQIDVLVVPSLVEESFSLAAAEAQAHGRPLIATAVGALADLVDHERNGLLVPPGDVGALTDAMTRMLDLDEVRRMAAEANGAMRPQIYAERIEEVYARVRARDAPAASRSSVAGSRSRPSAVR